jgi:hypothetical protein
VTDCRGGRGNDQDSGGLLAPWLLPRIDDWAAAASLGPCAQLNSSQSLRPWKLRPPSHPHCQCPQPNSSLLTESASVSFFCNVLRVRGPLRTYFVLDCNPPHSFFPSLVPTTSAHSILRPAITLSSRLLRSYFKPRDRFRFTTHIFLEPLYISVRFRTDSFRQLSCPILSRHFVPLSTNSITT